MLVSSAIRDVTERRRQQQELVWIAEHDLLSGLLNRRGMMEHLHQAIDRSRRTGSSVVVVLVDLDRFKLINDSLGHDVGDALLQQVSQRLQHAMRTGDTVTRVGGDEFAVIAEGVDLDSSYGAWIAERIAHALREPFSCANQPHVVQASIGISVFPEDSSNPTDLLRFADMAMYEAKERGGDGYAWANRDTAQRVSGRLAAERALRRAIDNDELELHYQPLYRLADGRLRGFEALLRWPAGLTEAFGVEESISLAESCGLILPLREWALLQEVEQTQQILTRLREMGVHIALDDFGTGYSSLSYLKRFNIDTLKIDREFITDLERDQDDQAIVKAILAMAAQLRLTVIAEGVETAGQAAFLLKAGCDFAQGFHWSAARPAHELQEPVV